MMRTALIDADVLSYEISSVGQFKDELTGEIIYRNFDDVAEMLDLKIREILLESECDKAKLYLTGDSVLNTHINKQHKFLGEKLEVFEPNFRHETAKVKPYKGTRKQEKPYHFHNLRAYMLSEYDCVVSNGIEADDLICIDLQYGIDVVACTRDKDLRMVTGWHYGWACGKQPAFGPERVDYLGYIKLREGKTKKLDGVGIKFFFAQVIMGDAVDNIPGLPKKGPVFAYELLADADSELECFKRVKQEYIKVYGDEWEEKLREQVDLLWMIRELDENNNPVFYKFPEEEV